MKWTLNHVANIATIVVASCAVVATVRLVRNSKQLPQTGQLEPDTVRVKDWQKYAVGEHTRGPANAPITIIEFGDYECPFCSRFAAIADTIIAVYPTQVRFIYRHWPLPMHRFSYPAARAAECAAEQDKFWPVHSLLYAKSDSLGLLPFSTIAERAGVADLKQFDVCYQRQGTVPVIDQAIKDVKLAGGSGTPTIIVNGLLVRRGIDLAYVADLMKKLGKSD